jgi:tetratricopeptide (TPR) repeat protein/S1-C subfamily serine protease
MKKNSKLILLGALLFITPQLQSCQLLPTVSQHFSQQQINRKLSSAELQQIVKAITVKVIGGEAGGSGTIIRKVGSTYTVVTNQHVLRAIQGTSKYRVETNNDDELTIVKNIRIQTSDGLDYPARIVTGENINFQDNDLGLLEFNADRIYDVGTFPQSDVRLKSGEKVWAAGFPAEASSDPPQPPLKKGGQSSSEPPLGKGGQLSSEPTSDSEPPLFKGGQGGISTEGEVSLIPDRALEQGYQLGYTNPIQSGMSGGPIINRDGDIVGFNGRHGNPLFGDPFVYADGSKPTDAERQKMVGLSWGLPVSVLAQAAPEMMKEVEPPFTGLAKQVYDQAKAVTVRIESRSKPGKEQVDPNWGSGVIIAKQKNTYYVVTASHVVQSSDKNYELVTPDDRRYRIDYDKIQQQEGQDVALVQFTSNEIYPVATIANYPVKLYDHPWVFTAGWPKGQALRNPRFEFTAGVRFCPECSAMVAQNTASLTYGYEMVYTNITQGGMSGGPVLNTQGRVVGIHGQAEGLGDLKLGLSLGIPANTLLGSLQLWGVERQWLQVETTPPPNLDKNQNTEVILAQFATLKQPSQKDASAKDWINYGNQLWRMGLSEPAVKAFDLAIQLDHNSYSAWYAKGLALSAADRDREAVWSFEEAIEIDDKRYEEAQKRGQEIDDRRYEAWREKGKALASLQQYPEALASIDQAIQRNNQDAVLYLHRGIILQELNRHQEAVEAYTKAIGLEPRPFAYYNRGVARYKSGDLPGAIADWTAAIKINPQFDDAYNNRGVARSDSGDLPGAIADYTEVIKLNPQDASAYNNRGVARSDSEDIKGAIADWTAAIKINPQDDEVYNNRGVARYKSGDIKGAIADYTAAIKINPQLDGVYNNRANARSDSGDIKGAIADWTAAIKINPQNDDAYNNRGLARYKSGDIKGAIADWTAAIKINPQNDEAYYNRGVARGDSGDLSGAIADYNQAIKINPQYANAYVNRGNARKSSGDIEGAIDDYTAAIKINPQLDEAYYNRGLARSDSGDIKGAIADYTEVIKLNPQDASAYNSRGNARSDSGDLPGAIDDYTAAIKINPQYASAYNNRGVARSDSGDLPGAIDDYTAAIKINPQLDEAYNNRGVARSDSGDLPGAIDDYTAAIKINPQNASAYYNRGLARTKSLDTEGAIADFTEAIKINPQNASAYRLRGSNRTTLGNIKGAIADYTEVIKLNPQDASTYNSRGVARFMLGDWSGAIADYTEVIKLNPQDASAYNNRGAAFNLSGDPAGAIADFTEVIKINPQNASAYKSRGHARSDSGDIEGAIDDYTKAIKINPQDAGTYSNRGVARYRSGDIEGAIDDYTKAIKINPQSAGTYNNRGNARYQSGDKEGGIEDMRKAERLFCQQGGSGCQQAKDNLKKMESGR